MKLLDILLEQQVSIHQGLIRVTYTEGMNVTDVEDIIRGIEGVTIVNSAGDDEKLNRVVLKIKVRSFEAEADAGKDAFIKVRRDAIKNQGIERVEIATTTIEKIR